jgi:hypothetical protein
MNNSAFENRQSATQIPQSEIENAQSDPYSPLVARVMRIEATTWGSPKNHYLLKYRGQLLSESEIAYDQLAIALRPYKVTPLFRIEDNQPTIYLIEGVIEPKTSNPWVNLVLFVLTIFSVLFAGALYAYSGPQSDDLATMMGYLLPKIWTGWPFAVSLLAILLAHEFGHYSAARYHRSAVTLP